MVARYLGSREFDAPAQLRAAASGWGSNLSRQWRRRLQVPDRRAHPSTGSRAIYSGDPWWPTAPSTFVDQIIRFGAEQRILRCLGAERTERGATLPMGQHDPGSLAAPPPARARAEGAKPSELPVDTSTEYELVVKRRRRCPRIATRLDSHARQSGDRRSVATSTVRAHLGDPTGPACAASRPSAFKRRMTAPVRFPPVHRRANRPPRISRD